MGIIYIKDGLCMKEKIHSEEDIYVKKKRE